MNHSLPLSCASPVKEIWQGLRSNPKTLPCKLFYDRRGSQLFDRICALPEYYPTRTETKILKEFQHEICEAIGPDCSLIELGSGSSQKTRLLLDGLESPVSYVPIDISGEHLEQSAKKMRQEYPCLRIDPLCADYTDSLEFPEFPPECRRRILFYPGSTIGNFHPAEACLFLNKLRSLCRAEDGLLIGFDLRKDPAVLRAAYNDGEGVTAEFNLNLIHRLNRDFDFSLDPSLFYHYADYREAPYHRIEMHLISTEEQVVEGNGHGRIRIREGESIRTECSYKHSRESIKALTRTGGFEPVRFWTDPSAWFCLVYCEPFISV